MEKVKFISGLLRISLGWLLLWAFLDKFFGLDISTSKQEAWIRGGSPTFDFLDGAGGYFSFVFQPLAGSNIIDFLFMIGLFLIGSALILGVAIKIASMSGSVMFFMMWLASLPLDHNPIVDDHIIYILVLVLLIYLDSGEYLGLGKRWKNSEIVKKYPILK